MVAQLVRELGYDYRGFNSASLGVARHRSGKSKLMSEAFVTEDRRKVKGRMVLEAKTVEMKERRSESSSQQELPFLGMDEVLFGH